MARQQLETTRSTVTLTSKAHKETKHRPHPFTRKTKLNQAIFSNYSYNFSAQPELQ